MSSLKSDYIKYRLSRAKESLIEAQLLAKNKHWNSAINRLYYSCFYMVTALLLDHNVNSKTHSGAHSQFNLHFVKTGKVSKEWGNLFTDLMNMRSLGDYGDIFDHDEKTVKQAMPQVKKFLKDIEVLINADETKSKNKKR